MLDYYTGPGLFTSPGAYAALFDALPTGVDELRKVGHGLLIHEHIAPSYGVTLSDQERAPVHLRPVEAVLSEINRRDSRPLTEARDPHDRLPGNCRQFTVLMVSMLRHQGIPSRARCGFGGYFGNAFFEDHWVCEYWNTDEDRWALVDAQIDGMQLKLFDVDFALTDVPRDRFMVAGDAWARCRAAQADPARFGLSFMNESGYWWIAGNLMRDAAALCNVELLPWDVWGAMPEPYEDIDSSREALFTELAKLTAAPAERLTELQAMLRDDRLRVPAEVYNAVLNRREPLLGAPFRHPGPRPTRDTSTAGA